MSKVQQWIWRVYTIALFVFTFEKTFNFFNPGSPQHIYFKILLAFDRWYLFIYSLNVIQLTLGFLQGIVILFYIFNVRFLNLRLYQWLLCLHLIFDVVGHPYEMMFFSSLYIEDKKLFLIVFAGAIAFYVPAYLAFYRYAFWGRMFNDDYKREENKKVKSSQIRL